MTKTVIGLYDDFGTALNAARDLKNNDFDGSDISIVANDADGKFTENKVQQTYNTQGFDNFKEYMLPTAGPMGARGPLADRIDDIDTDSGYRSTTGTRPAATSAAGYGYDYETNVTGDQPGMAPSNQPYRSTGATKTFADILNNIGVPQDDAEAYAEAIRQGGTLVSIGCSDDKAGKAADILQKYGPMNPDEGQQSMQGSRSASTPQNLSRSEEERDQDSAVVPEIKEHLNVGKRQVETGGVRVRTYVTEQPVEQKVTLRKESVNVSREKVDRPANQEDLDAFKEKTIRIPVITEEAEVHKEPHVTEEVVIRKDVDEKQQTVKDKVRETHVDTERIGGSQQANDQYDEQFRNHFNHSYTDSEFTYDQYRPAYQYGYNLGNNPRFKNRGWDKVESEARSRWDQTNPDVIWDQVDDAVEMGFKAARGKS